MFAGADVVIVAVVVVVVEQNLPEPPGSTTTPTTAGHMAVMSTSITPSAPANTLLQANNAKLLSAT